MLKKIIIILILLATLTAVAQKITAQDRYAVCDLCGYCPPNNPPSTWEKCQQCIYPDASSDPQTKETLRIDPATNLVPTPRIGRQYTMIGCIRSDLGSFRSEGAAAGVVQALLNIIFSTAGGLAFLFVLYGGFIIATSQSNPERLGYGKKIVYGAIVGLVFTLLSVFIVNLIAGGILKIPGFE